jgi:hypothetical protein
MKLSTYMLYAVARLEVLRWSDAAKEIAPSSTGELLASMVPSVCCGVTRDRTLAEFDQNGCCFATDPKDQSFFGTCTAREPRRNSQVSVVLSGGKVRVRKRLLPQIGETFGARLRRRLGWRFYIEAAALARLQRVRGVPALRHIDTHTRTIEMDYVWGQDIRREIVNEAGACTCEEVHRIFCEKLRSNQDGLGSEVQQLLTAVMERGVFPLDLHAANFIRENSTGILHLVDYQLVYLRPVPGWRTRRRALTRWLNSPLGHQYTDPLLESRTPSTADTSYVDTASECQVRKLNEPPAGMR